MRKKKRPHFVFRYLDGTYLFEVDNVKRRMRLIEDALIDVGAHDFEGVSIGQLDPVVTLNGTVADVFERTIMRFQSNPSLRHSKWFFSRQA